MKIVPRRQGRFGFSASAKDGLPTYTLEEGEAMVAQLERDQKEAMATSKSKLDAEAIWNKFNRRT